VKSYKNPSLTFKPKIINLKKRDADKVIAEIERKINAGEQADINPLEIIYLPLYGSKSKKTTAELLDTAIKLTPKVASDDKNKRNKLCDLLILLTATFVSDEELNRILEANMFNLENNRAVRVLEARGEARGDLQRAIKVARKMLQAGEDYTKISTFTELDMDRIAELDKERLALAG